MDVQVREVTARAVRALAAAALLASAAAGYVCADAFAAEHVRVVAPLRTARPPAPTARPARRVDPRTPSAAAPSVAVRAPAPETPSAPAPATAPPAWRPGEATSSMVAGVGGGEPRATATWRVVYDLPGGAQPADDEVERRARRFAAGVAETLAAEAPLGPPPWNDAAFQACGAVDGRLAVVGRQFWPNASPDASASWYARTLCVRPDDASVAGVVARLARYEAERAELVRRILDRLLVLARGAATGARCAAYYAEAGRVFLFPADAFPEVDADTRAAAAAQGRRAARAAEICR